MSCKYYHLNHLLKDTSQSKFTCLPSNLLFKIFFSARAIFVLTPHYFNLILKMFEKITLLLKLVKSRHSFLGAFGLGKSTCSCISEKAI